MEFPELKDDEVFLNAINLDFSSNQLFEEFKRLANMEKRAGVITTLLSLQTAEGQPYFHIDYLIDKYFQLTPEEKEENKAYWTKYGGGGAGAAEGGEAGMEAPVEGGAQMAPEGAPEAPPEGGEAPPPAPEAGGEPGGAEFEF